MSVVQLWDTLTLLQYEVSVLHIRFCVKKQTLGHGKHLWIEKVHDDI
jgi:hypothetical protein